MMIILKSVKCIFADIMYFFSEASVKALIDADVNRNLKWDAAKDRLKGKIMRLNYLLLKKIEFRNIFYLRVKRQRHLSAFCKVFLPGIDTIEFGSGEIGGGLLISHYHSVICPGKTGANFRVGPGVVIDRDRDSYPTFGNNIYVASNSTVTGNVYIGDNVIIGAGSVVTENLSGNGVYVGNPAKFLKHIDDNKDLLNEIM